MSLTVRYQNFWKFNEKTLKNKYELNLDHQTDTMQKSLYRSHFLSQCDSSLIKMYCDRVEQREKTLALTDLTWTWLHRQPTCDQRQIISPFWLLTVSFGWIRSLKFLASKVWSNLKFICLLSSEHFLCIVKREILWLKWKVGLGNF